MTFNRDFENYADIAQDRQAEILRVSAASNGRRPAIYVAAGVFLAVVGAPLAAVFFLRVW